MLDFHKPPPAIPTTWTETAWRVLRERYLARQPDGSQESPEAMLWRVACAVAAAEHSWHNDADVLQTAQSFYRLMAEQRFLPNSPTLMNAGRDNALQYSACYVLPLEDSLSDIFETVKRAALIHQSGGGTGFAFSRLRARNAEVHSTGGKASGPVSFLRVFNAATEAVKQGGTRRGANMGILRVDHPDILEFVDCKRDGDITNFNLSVAITDEFWHALERQESYAVVDPAVRVPVATQSATEVWQHIVSAAWQTGDPGLIFIDRINRSPANPTPEVGSVEATNPCGEQPLLPNEACNLGSINVGLFVSDSQDIEWGELERCVRLAVRFLDDVIEVNPYPLPEIDAMVKANRRIGLGVMGWADMLIRLGVPYDSSDAVALADRVMGFIQRVGHQTSEELAVQRGPFPNWPRSIYRNVRPLRNATVTTVAPTGTISILAGCSSGIEPLFAVSYTHQAGERTLSFVHPLFERLLQQRGLDGAEVMARVRRAGTVQGDPDIPLEVQRLFVSAHEISADWHVRMQAAFQKQTDNGVSKTINLPNRATEEDVDRAYRQAWSLGCLGITVFRDGCKPGQVLTAGTAGGPAPHHLAPRPRRASGETWRVETPLGTAFVTLNEGEEGQPMEVFANVGKAGSDTAAVSEAIGRLISLALRLPSPWSPSHRLQEIVDQLAGIGGARPLGFGDRRVRSLPDGIAQVLAEYLQERDGTEASGPAQDLCPDCGAPTLIAAEGCQKCHSCGYSVC